MISQPPKTRVTPMIWLPVSQRMAPAVLTAEGVHTVKSSREHQATLRASYSLGACAAPKATSSRSSVTKMPSATDGSCASPVRVDSATAGDVKVRDVPLPLAVAACEITMVWVPVLTDTTKVSSGIPAPTTRSPTTTRVSADTADTVVELMAVVPVMTRPRLAVL